MIKHMRKCRFIVRVMLAKAFTKIGFARCHKADMGKRSCIMDRWRGSSLKVISGRFGGSNGVSWCRAEVCWSEEKSREKCVSSA